ncbi:hypothetical protein IMZ31_19390 (plasmid) [Pontibacillus sp. ALD_SL1]|uniref:hypothetical protein n=1 Tax=Pontibacillus sp. ALD_SL1 TaxID=2777185 RepID=UPI001A967CAC|nr:hypothetical protein [Pontibacillus sp. ALD_SL1]QST02715.1 hypothetical protein IMZ31_19390 [Pontibacillus sp. ALD_SL1]
MFRPVMTKKDHQLFNAIWDSVARESRFKTTEATGNEQRFLLLDESGRELGTAEFARYTPYGHSLLRGYKSYDEHPKLRSLKGNVFEIAKLGIQKGMRNKGYFKHMMVLMNHLATTQKVDYFVAVVDSKLVRMVERVGIKMDVFDELIETDHFTLYPVILNVRKLRKNPFIRFVLYRLNKRTIETAKKA